MRGDGRPGAPWLTDSTEELDALLGRIAAVSATGASVLPLHLRPGAREWYFGWLRQHRPDLVTRYDHLYAGGSYAAKWYPQLLAERVGPLLVRHGLGRAGTRAVGEGDYPRGSLPTTTNPPVEQQAAATLF